MLGTELMVRAMKGALDVRVDPERRMLGALRTTGHEAGSCCSKASATVPGSRWHRAQARLRNPPTRLAHPIGRPSVELHSGPNRLAWCAAPGPPQYAFLRRPKGRRHAPSSPELVLGRSPAPIPFFVASSGTSSRNQVRRGSFVLARIVPAAETWLRLIQRPALVAPARYARIGRTRTRSANALETPPRCGPILVHELHQTVALLK